MEQSFTNEHQSKLEQFILWINQINGRDNVCKTLQYLCKILKIYFWTIKEDEEWSDRFLLFSNAMRDARKHFRLFNTIQEIHRIIQIKNFNYNDEFDRIVNIIIRVFYCIHWYYDNLTILSSVRFIKEHSNYFNRIGNKYKLLALIIKILLNIRHFLRNQHKKILFKRTLGEINSEEENESVQLNIEKIRNRKKKILLNILKLLGAILPALDESGLLKEYFDINMHEMIHAVGGLISSVIQYDNLYQSYQLI